MSEHDPRPPLPADQEAARRAVSALPHIDADPGFRDRLRSRFASGQLEGRPSPASRWRLQWPRPAGVLGWPWVVGLAASLVVVLGLNAVNRGPGWSIAEATGAGSLQIDGRPVSTDAATAGHVALAPGSRLAVPSGVEVTLVSRGTLLLQVTGGTELVLPGPPGRWWGRRARGQLRAGEVRATTGARFAGATLQLTTPEAMVEVTGTTFALIALPCVTCLCVYDGAVMLRPLGGPAAPVSAPGRKMVFSDGRPAVVGELEPAERAQLGKLHDAGRQMLGAGPPAGGATLDFDLPRYDGGHASLGQLRRQGPVVVDFWATWCAPCKRALPRYQALHQQYVQHGVTFVAVSEDDPRSQSKIAPFVQAQGLAFPVLLDGDGSVARRFGVTDLPTTFVISSQGQVVSKRVGYTDGDEHTLERELRTLLGLAAAPADSNAAPR